LFAATTVAQHWVPASELAQSEGAVQPTLSSAVHVVWQSGCAVVISAQHVPLVQGVLGQLPTGAPPELLLPLELPLLEPLLLPLLEPLLLLPLLLLPLLELPLLLLPLELPDDELPLELPLGGAVVDDVPLQATQTIVHAMSDAAPKTTLTDARDTMGNLRAELEVST
jgi:hypothetical protein